MATNGQACLGVMAFLGWLIAIIIFGTSFQVIEVNHVGFDLNSNTNKVNLDKVYPPGRHFVGVGHTFLTYPTTYQTVEFSREPGADHSPLLVVSGARLTLEVEFSFMYTLDIDNLKRLYETYTTNYRPIVLQIAETVVKETTATFPSESFYTDRDAVKAAISENLSERLLREFVNLQLFQLRFVGLPTSVTEKNLSNAINDEEGRTKSWEKDVLVEISSIDVLTKESEESALTIGAQAEAEAQELLQQAIAQGDQLVIDAEAEAFFEFRESLGFTDAQMLKYMWMKELSGVKKTKVLVGMEGRPAIVDGLS